MYFVKFLVLYAAFMIFFIVLDTGGVFEKISNAVKRRIKKGEKSDD